MHWRCERCGLEADVTTEHVVHQCAGIAPQSTGRVSIIEKLPAESRKLLGDRAADLFAALGIPKCSSCAARQAWLNAAHRWVLEKWG